jgi:hypothetical protein
MTSIEVHSDTQPIYHHHHPAFGDAPRARQHTRKCAQQRLGTRSPTRRSGGVATRVPQPHHHTTSTFQRPRAPSYPSGRLQTQQEYRALVLRQIPSESGRSCALIFLNITKTSLGLLKTLKARAGDSASNKRLSQQGLVPPRLPLPRRTTPDVAHRVARPRRVHIEIWRQWPIGRSERSQNWWTGRLE